MADISGVAPVPLVIGAGSFGTAIAAAIARSGFKVDIYCRTPEQAAEIEKTRKNQRFFPNSHLSELISATNDLSVIKKSRIIFFAFPASNIDYYIGLIENKIDRENIILVNLVKGLHNEHFTFSALVKARAPWVHYVALKGPTFARPIFFGELSGLTCGAPTDQGRDACTMLLKNSGIDLDYSTSADAVDVVSAIKNVYAIALGLTASLGLSENTRFLLISRVIRELRTIILALKEDPDVLYTYSGLGDMLLTGLCDTSRNRTLGFMIGKGIHVDKDKSTFLTEGLRTISMLNTRVGSADTPILRSLIEIINHRSDPLSILEAASR
jgi:glycerol-3-phosphate dehydrogenase (NAD(P)+)